jgi:hypothetical protein
MGKVGYGITLRDFRRQTRTILTKAMKQPATFVTKKRNPNLTSSGQSSMKARQ